MAIKAKFKDTVFCVGDIISISQKVKDKDKKRDQVFEGMVISIKGRSDTRTFTIRRIGEQKIGIERIFPLNLPSIESITVKRKGYSGIRRAKLYYTRGKSKREIEKIFHRESKKTVKKDVSKK